MIKYLKFLLYAHLLIFAVNTTIAQKAQLDSLTKKFNQYRTHALQEKLYAHIDRSSYLTGEILWFKIYYVDAGFHRPLDVSKVAYVEVIGKENESVLQAKIELKDGVGRGSIFIPASLSSGNYIFRAYTNWMKNFSPELYFHQPITIINTFVKTEPEAKTNNLTYDAQFFPEGGNMIVGLKSKIGFRVIDPTGKGIEFNGTILNMKNDTVASFKPLRFGIGSFYFTPAPGEKYKILIKDVKGNKSYFSLPETKDAGYTMHIKDKKDKLEIEVSGDLNNSVPLIYLFAHTRQVTIKAESKFLNQGKTSFTIDKKDLKEGITHLTLFNSDLQPVCERLYFIRPEKKLEIAIQTVQQEYDPRSKVTLNLKTNISAGLSVSVYKIDSIASPASQNIYEYLWLSSDLKGKIESPEYYFDNTDSIADLALDNLMLTHGWRRFSWTTVLSSKPSFQYVPEFRGHIIHGKVVDATGAPAAGVLTYLSSPDKIVHLYGSRSSSLGEVRYEMKNFTDERKIFAQINTRIDSIHRVKIENPFSTQYSSLQIPPFQILPDIGKQLLNRSIAMQVQDVYSREQINHFAKATTDSVPFYGKADEVYKLDDFTRFPILEEVLREYVPGVLVRKRKDGFHFMVLDNVNKSVFREDPMVLLDGVPIFNNDQILAFSPLKIKKLEVLDREYYLGQLIFPGAMLFSTYQNDLGGFQVDPRSFSMNYEGLQLQREFYSPLYESQQARDSRVPDQRTLLYWNSSLQTEKQISQQVHFYTSDVKGKYQVVIEGISKDGTAGSSFYNFSVRPVGQ